MTLWTDIEAVRGFAGSNSREAAVSYPEDDAFLVSADQTVEHTDAVELEVK